MNKQDCEKLYDLLIYNNKNFQPSKELKEHWGTELSQYDADEVLENAKELLRYDQTFIYNPNVYQLTKGLTKKNDKIDYSKTVWYCHNCKRPYNDFKELEKHEERCNSIYYILNQYKRFNWSNVPVKKELYNMSGEEFDEKYNKLLKLVQKYTDDESERTRIEFIFNPPSLEEARRFLAREI